MTDSGKKPVPKPDPLRISAHTPTGPGPAKSGNLQDPHYDGSSEEATVSVSKKITRPEIQRPPMDSGYKPVVNREFGRYELLIELGGGGMATLYLARLHGPQSFQKLLAIKRIHEHLSAETEFVEMFLDEARLAAQIHHPNVATIFEFGELQRTYYIAMEYVHGQNLSDVLKTGAKQPERFPWTCAARMVADAATGLHAAHELKGDDGQSLSVVHRDISPQNVLVSYDGHVKLVDFGVAYAAEKVSQTTQGAVKGKVAYMSPEQADGQPLDRRSDIFSLGIVLYEAVCLRRLFKRESEPATLLAVCTAEVPPPRKVNPALPVRLERILQRCLEKKPSDRYSSAQELAEELEELLVGKGEVITQKRVARLMEELFGDRKTKKDEQIQEAMSTTTTNPLVGVGHTETHSVSLSLNAVPDTRAWWRRPAGLVVALVVALLFAGGALLLVDPGGWFSKPKTAPEGDPAVTPRTPPQMKTPMDRDHLVTVRVKVTPAVAGCQVVFRGKTYHGAAFSAVIPRSSQPETLVVRAPGHKPQSLLITPARDVHLPVTLQPGAGPTMRPDRTGRRPGSMRKRPMGSMYLLDLPMDF